VAWRGPRALSKLDPIMREYRPRWFYFDSVIVNQGVGWVKKRLHILVGYLKWEERRRFMSEEKKYYALMKVVANEMISRGAEAKPIVVGVNQQSGCYFYELIGGNNFEACSKEIIKHCQGQRTKSAMLLKFRVCNLTEIMSGDKAQKAYFLQEIRLNANNTLRNSTLACALGLDERKKLTVKNIMGIDGEPFPIPCELKECEIKSLLYSCTLPNLSTH
jgi:hypothetical protein